SGGEPGCPAHWSFRVREESSLPILMTRPATAARQAWCSSGLRWTGLHRDGTHWGRHEPRATVRRRAVIVARYVDAPKDLDGSQRPHVGRAIGGDPDAQLGS